MTPTDLLARAEAQGIEVSLKGDTTLWVHPQRLLTPELRAALVAHEPELLELLRAQSWSQPRAYAVVREGTTAAASAYTPDNAARVAQAFHAFDDATAQAFQIQDMAAVLAACSSLRATLNQGAKTHG